MNSSETHSLTLRYTALACLTAFMCLNPALAFAAADWASPAVEVFSSLEGGMTKIGTVAVGIGLVGYGVYSAVFGEMRWQKMFQYILGAILIVAAPAAIRTLVNMGS
ncbi:TrbC/VirB2 family protein [Pseudovibrio ascidiaceicola]|uniref:TrbC/VirB2 family protein n=1 Tax=Pseudovibrio ascidiaceicola TaxID=285279 RepID=UPI003D364195